jgi:hypothetical protein
VSAVPRIKVMLPNCYPDEGTFELEQARPRLNFDGGTFLVEGQYVKSFDELVKLTSQDKYKDREYIEVAVVLDKRCC